MNQLKTKIKQAIEEAENILIVIHAKPDGDAIGAAFAMLQFCLYKQKKVRIFAEKTTANFGALLFPYLISQNDLEKENFDLIIALDCGDYSRTQLPDSWRQEKKIINIDHHISNDIFGRYNLVRPDASSTTEILTQLFQDWNYNFSAETATLLLNGLLTDTGNFTNKGTSPWAFSCASFLLQKGANLNKIIQNSQQENSLEALKTWGESFQRLKIHPHYRFAYTLLTQEEIKKAQKEGYEDKLEEMVNFFNNLKEPPFIMVLKEQNNKIKVSLRTNKEKINVNKFAQIFGGGGHLKAAGFSFSGRLEKINGKWRILPLLDEKQKK